MNHEVIAKATAILCLAGKTTANAVGPLVRYADSFLCIESYLYGRLHMRVGYSDTGMPAFELWDQSMLCHPGNHDELRAYVGAIFTALTPPD